jgi:hypothetical protein
MAVTRMDNMGIVVEDLAETIEFFRELSPGCWGLPSASTASCPLHRSIR